MAEKTEGTYQERENRVMCAIQLKVPDRVPVYVHWELFPRGHSGVKLQEESAIPVKWFASIKKAILDFQPDMYSISDIIQDSVHKFSNKTQFNCPGHGFLTDEIHECGKKRYIGDVKKWNATVSFFHKEMAASGFVIAAVSSTFAPFDLIANTLRGVRGTMLDLYRQPQKLLEAMDKLLPTVAEHAISDAKRSGNQRVLIPLHWGADGYLSVKQFEIFYWPTFEKLILSIIDAGLTPYPFFEGTFDSRLKYLAKLPKGKVVGEFDATDVFNAKKIIGDTMCIIGNMPASLLQRGTEAQIKDYSKKLIDIVGEGGGFIMGLRSVMNDVNPQLVKIWFEFTRKYGRYR